LRAVNTQLDTRRAFIEAVLGSVTAGIVALDGQNRILLIQDASNTTLALLDSKAFRQAEPIRTMELSRASKTRVALLEKRGAAAQGNVASVMASAIDAWLSALDTFDDDALKPEPKALLGRLKEFRAKATAARNAVKAAAAAQ